MKDLLSSGDLSREDYLKLIHDAQRLKKTAGLAGDALKGKHLGLYSSKPSLRTRVSFEVGIAQLGGHCSFLRPDEIGFGTREQPSDIAQVLARYLDGLIVRTHEHSLLEELAKASSMPIINALSADEHPCQALADMVTILERFGVFLGLKLTYIGAANNVSNSLMLSAAILGLEFTIISPENSQSSRRVLEQAKALARLYGSKEPRESDDPNLAVEADLLYTDVWVSMGEEQAGGDIAAQFAPYQLNSELTAGLTIPVLHCLPAHREEELTGAVFHQNKELIFTQAENRLHAQKALMIKLLASG